ncbi:MAG: hypothetical protein IRZ16_19780 [Myxococcaceae bacterium]|nr:hypothetical protein [Myxococcaceae bacterium]
MNAAPTRTPAVEYAIPEGCPVCAGDLQVKVTTGAGPNGVCVTCGYFAKPVIGVIHHGLHILFKPQAHA